MFLRADPSSDVEIYKYKLGGPSKRMRNPVSDYSPKQVNANQANCDFFGRASSNKPLPAVPTMCFANHGVGDERVASYSGDK